MAPRTINSIFPQAFELFQEFEKLGYPETYSDFSIIFVFKDNYFEEALKMRNLLQEFEENHGIRPATILGVREHVFTGRYMADRKNYSTFSLSLDHLDFDVTMAVSPHWRGLCQTRKQVLSPSDNEFWQDH